MADARLWTSVSMPYVSGHRSDAWAVEAAEHGGSGTQKLLGVEEVPAPEMVADMLGVEPGEAVVLRRRVMLFNDHPVELTDSYYPAAIARGTKLAEPRKIRGGAVALLADLGHPPRRLREDVSARLATPDEQDALRLDAAACVLLLARVLLTDEDRPVEASVMTMVADGRRLRYELTP
ncbi:UTRA domain-containing protein [Actinokineospora auranticolor]|uniref:UTRA domain-containing protein n=1 Tax=Actinokineospora auranticolor TaxID=155976 RepID=A0A2S6GDM6_9PSEU|nr:UTRA domain-containing protein [Actinokineospora auranticolor]PPK63348.1 UTRA domain-containing protein [Actinokineospora auranticolor]